jgi:Transglutaminase-like superfamily
MRSFVLKLVGFLFLFFAWAIPIALCADKRFGPGAAFGAIIGVGLAIAMSRISIGSKWLLFINSWNESVLYLNGKIKLNACLLALIFGVILWSMASVPVYIDAIPVGLALNLGDAIRAALLVFIAIIVLGVITNWMLGIGRLLECTLIGLVAADCWRTHRGNFSRPHYFTDWLIINGHSTAIGYGILALGLLLLLWLYSVGSSWICITQKPVDRSLLGVALPRTDFFDTGPKAAGMIRWFVTGVSGMLVYLVVWVLFPLPSVAPRAPSSPPLTFTADPPPPSPPEPDIIALVELSKPLFIPSLTLGGYYFRTSTPDPDIDEEVQEKNALLKDGDLKHMDQPKAAIVVKKLTVTKLEREAAFNSLTNPQSVQSIWWMSIRMRVRPQLPWAVPGLLSSEIKTDERARFTIKEELSFKSNFNIRFNPRNLENIKNLNKVFFTDENWDDKTKFLYTNENTASLLTAKLEVILKPLRPHSALKATKLSALMNLLKNEVIMAESDVSEIPVARLIAIREWLETNAIYDDRALPPKDSSAVFDYLSSDLKGGDAHLARAGVLLLRTAGIPSRVACGYFVPLEKQTPDRFIVTDQHATEWIEIHICNFGWFPFAIHPKQVVSHKQQPPLKEKQDEVLRELDAAKSENKLKVQRVVYTYLPVVFGLAIMSIGLYFMKRFRIYQRAFNNVSKNISERKIEYHRNLLYLSSNLFRLAGKEYHNCSTWMEYADQIESDPALKKVGIEYIKLVEICYCVEKKLETLTEIEKKNIFNIYSKIRSAMPFRHFVKILLNKDLKKFNNK